MKAIKKQLALWRLIIGNRDSDGPAPPRTSARRRGVIMLVVLSLLVLFLLVGVTFVIVANQYKKSSDAYAKQPVAAPLPEKDLFQALMHVVRGSTTGALASGDLLEDMYGTHYLEARVNSAGATTDAGGAVMELKYSVLSNNLPDDLYFKYSGNIVTMLDGPAAGLSTRCFCWLGERDEIRILPFKREDGAVVSASDLAGYRFLVSGRPFSGQVVSGVEINEDYDAPDLLNPLLAYRPNQPLGAGGLTSAQIVPSLHRPAYMNFKINSGPPTSSSGFDGVLKRPMPWENTYFTGSSPAFTVGMQADGKTLDANANAQLYGALVDGPWDVDNDGDGVRDSIWVDLGFPIRTDPYGQKYKPLFAILCLDLDNRLDVNAHGSPWHTTSAYTSDPTEIVAGNASSASNVTERRPGVGFGPADVNLGLLFGSTATLGQILYGSGSTPGRYGSDGEPGGPTQDPLTAIAFPGVPTASASGQYMWPADLWGRGVPAVDPRGNPHWIYAGGSAELLNTPYEMSERYDAPFTEAELERLLRSFDADAGMLPDRLVSLGGATFDTVQNRYRVTTRTSQYGGLVGYAPNWMITNWRVLPIAMKIGEKFNLNVPFANGRDDNSNDTVDDPAEHISGETAFEEPTADPSFSAVPHSMMGGLGDPIVPYHQRQAMARGLYVLMSSVFDDAYLPPTTESTLTSAQRSALLQRQIAQWAINCVDFRDPDGIMTPFEYDPDLSNGWNALLDGNPTSPETGDRDVVWGMEYPDLLITEAHAWHDRGVKDTNLEQNGEYRAEETDESAPDDRKWEEKDEDLDQFRIPRGSLFFELYATGPLAENNANPPPELYDDSSGTVYLDLGRMAPAASGQPQVPVWRAVITEDHVSAGSVDSLFYSKPTSTALLPGGGAAVRTNILDPSAALNIERIVWFAPQTPTAGMPQENIIFYNRAGSSALLQTGGYAVVGPRQTTYISAKPTGGTGDRSNSSQRITLSPTIFNSYNFDDDSTWGGSLKIRSNVLGIIAAAEGPAGWAAAAKPTVYGSENGVGISISEPLPQNYYSEPHTLLSGSDASIGYDGYTQDGTSAGTVQPLDQPLERSSGGDVNFPLNQNTDWIQTGTHTNVKTLVLQRLANPLRAYHATGNPYISVDWMPIDLTTFNGEDQEPTTDPDGARAWSDRAFFEDDGAGGWTSVATPPWDPDDPSYPSDMSPVNFASRRKGSASAGLLWSAATSNPDDNETSGVATSAFFPFVLKHSLGYLNDELGTPDGATSEPGYLGSPDSANTFPWIPWNNRPYANKYELLLVPASDPSRFTGEFSINTAAPPYAGWKGRFGPYLNFFQSTTAAGSAPHFYRVFDYVDVPSPFVDDSIYLPPGLMHAGGGLCLYLKPPYNRLCGYRRRGMVNVNTISDATVLQAVTRLGGPDASALFSAIDHSRRGYDPTVSTPASSDNTQFKLPFRGAVRTSVGGVDREIENTLLRPLPTDANTPLFLSVTGSQAYNNPGRHPYFRFEGLTSAGNLLGTQSNVYAVWITVGYFEMVPDPNHGNALRLGQEMGAATGDIRRHRGFYILDRTIPVGYFKGQNLNAEKAILLKRFIE